MIYKQPYHILFNAIFEWQVFALLGLLWAGQPLVGWGQYPPAAGKPGSTAIHKDSSAIKSWALRAEVIRGWQDISTKEQKVDFGTADNVLGPADGQVVSLGDSGVAVLEFDPPIRDGEGPDLAVFENAFDDHFLELAHVEVSSDGEHFYRFPSVSLTDTTGEVGTFDPLDPTKLHHLAGKYRVFYGTPFDLSSLGDAPLLDKMHVRYVKIIDVIGRVKNGVGSRDSRGVPINDPYPTPFPTGGFDLDGVASLHLSTIATKTPLAPSRLIALDPIPTGSGMLHLRVLSGAPVEISIWDVSGMKWYHTTSKDHHLPPVPCSAWPEGMYFITAKGAKNQLQILKLIK